MDAHESMFSTLFTEEVSQDKKPCHAQKMGITGKEIFTSVSESVNPVESSNPTLLNRKPPQYVRQQEMAWHRSALEYHAQGFTAREIAGMLGCSPTAVQDILRQPQYQQTQVNLIKQEVNRDREVVEKIKEAVVNAVDTLIEISTSEKCKPADRIAASRELLNRRYGMPNQPINRNTDVDLSKLSDSELAQMLVGETVTRTNR